VHCAQFAQGVPSAGFSVHSCFASRRRFLDDAPEEPSSQPRFEPATYYSAMPAPTSPAAGAAPAAAGSRGVELSENGSSGFNAV
jgi:hypothetical protein